MSILSINLYLGTPDPAIISELLTETLRDPKLASKPSWILDTTTQLFSSYRIFLKRYTLEINDDFTRNTLRGLLNSTFEEFINSRTIDTFNVVCDASVNSNDDIEQGFCLFYADWSLGLSTVSLCLTSKSLATNA